MFQQAMVTSRDTYTCHNLFWYSNIVYVLRCIYVDIQSLMLKRLKLFWSVDIGFIGGIL